MLNTLVLEGRTTQDGHDLVRDGGLAKCRFDVGLAEVGVVVEEALHERFVGLSNCLNQNRTRRGSLVGELGRNLNLVPLGAQGVVLELQRLHLDQVDHALELIFAAKRKLNRNSRCARDDL